MLNSIYIILIMICFAMVIFAITNQNGSLDSFKDKTVGHGQHGTARFATDAEIKKTYHFVRYTPNLWRQGKNLPEYQGIVVGSITHGRKTTALIDDGDVHALMIGAAGVGKTSFFLYPNLEYACASGMSFLTTDTKGDLYRNYAPIARDYYGYSTAIIDLRNPSMSDAWNMLHLVNEYMDLYLADTRRIDFIAKVEKYAKITAKTIIYSDSETTNYGQNQFFYDAAEGLLAAVILIVAEFANPNERHIISVFKIIQDLLSPNSSGELRFRELMNNLPENHRAKWLAGSALNTADQSMQSVLSTALARLNAFLDTEMEQVLCRDTVIDAEKFCNQKSAIFLVMPEEDNTKYFLVSLIIQQIYREILVVADEQGGKLKNRVIFYCDELGVLNIHNIENIFASSRSRRISIIALIQALAQFEKNYGKEGAEIIVDNCQLSIFGSFAPNSQTAEVLSKNLGTRTVLSGSITRGKNDPSQSLQMIERPLMTPDELKSLKRGDFIVMRTGTHPMKAKFKLFTKWGITFGKEYKAERQEYKKIEYADIERIIKAIRKKYSLKREGMGNSTEVKMQFELKDMLKSNKIKFKEAKKE